MAWEIMSRVGDLVMSYNDGEEDHDIDIVNCKSAEMYLDQRQRVIANPFSLSGVPMHTVRNNQGSAYNEIELIGDTNRGSIDLRNMYNILPTGRAMYIWRRSLGRGYRVAFTKTNWSYDVTFVAAGVAVYSTTYGVREANLTTYQTLTFVLNEETYQGDFVVMYYLASSTYQYPRQLGVDWIYSGGDTATINKISSVMYPILHGNTPAPEPPGPSTDEPYGDDTYDTSTGGDGGHDDTSDTIELPAIPLATATRSGMCTAWVPNWGEIQDVADALLDPNIFQILSGNVVKFSDVIIGLSIFPCIIPATDTDTVKANVLGIEIGTGVQAHIADDQFVTVDCGTLDIDEYWGNCLDYNPYTRISIFLPFCGMYELDVDEVMGKTLGVSYRIDIMSGACLATIKINGSVFYQYSGQCSAQVPLSSVSFDQFLSSMIELGVATATGVGAIGAAGAGVKEAETAFKAAGSSGSGGSELMEAREHLSSVKTQSANSIADASVGAVMGSKGFYQHAGAMSGSPGFLGVRTPYVIIKRPEQLIPGMYGKFHGFPCNTTAVLGDLVGYTEVGDIRLNIPEATVEEIIECEQLLKGGVVI